LYLFEQNNLDWCKKFFDSDIHPSDAKIKQSCLRSFSASRGLHLIPGELLSVTEQDALFEDLLKEHVNHMEQTNLLKELIH
jgi:hypothetical protein